MTTKKVRKKIHDLKPLEAKARLQEAFLPLQDALHELKEGILQVDPSTGELPTPLVEAASVKLATQIKLLKKAASPVSKKEMLSLQKQQTELGQRRGIKKTESFHKTGILNLAEQKAEHAQVVLSAQDQFTDRQVSDAKKLYAAASEIIQNISPDKLVVKQFKFGGHKSPTMDKDAIPISRGVNPIREKHKEHARIGLNLAKDLFEHEAAPLKSTHGLIAFGTEVPPTTRIPRKNKRISEVLKESSVGGLGVMSVHVSKEVSEAFKEKEDTITWSEEQSLGTGIYWHDREGDKGGDTSGQFGGKEGEYDAVFKGSLASKIRSLMEEEQIIYAEIQKYEDSMELYDEQEEVLDPDGDLREGQLEGSDPVSHSFIRKYSGFKHTSLGGPLTETEAFDKIQEMYWAADAKIKSLKAKAEKISKIVGNKNSGLIQKEKVDKLKKAKAAKVLKEASYIIKLQGGTTRQLDYSAFNSLVSRAENLRKNIPMKASVETTAFPGLSEGGLVAQAAQKALDRKKARKESTKNWKTSKRGKKYYVTAKGNKVYKK